MGRQIVSMGCPELSHIHAGRPESRYHKFQDIPLSQQPNLVGRRWRANSISVKTRGYRCFAKYKPHAGRRKGRKIPFLSLVTLTLTFKLLRARNQTRLPYEFVANPFSGSQEAVSEIFYTQTKKSQTSPKTEPYAVHCVR